MLSTFSSVLGPLSLGALGWLATHFLAKPLLAALDLRKRAWEELLVTANVDALAEADYEASVQTLRRLAARASALDVAWPNHLRWLLARGLRYDLAGAAAGLLGLSNTLHQTRGGAFAHRRRVETALRLPRSITLRNDPVAGEPVSP